MKINKALLDDLDSSVKLLKQLAKKNDRKILLAVSGGSDSIGMLMLASDIIDANRLIVGFVDHGLRKGVDAEWQLVKNTANKLNIKNFKETIAPQKVIDSKNSSSIQQWARNERYKLLNQIAVANNAFAICTAHTMDDQAETVMLRILRGTGIDGLSGIPLTRLAEESLVLWRPMLEVSREQIRKLLRDVNVSWAEDPSNKNLQFARVKVRQELLPLMELMAPKIASRLCSLSKEIKGISDFVDSEIEDKSRLITLRLAGGVKVGSEQFDKFPKPLWGRLLRYALKHVNGDLRRFERAHLDPIVKLLVDKKSASDLPLPGNITAYLHKGNLFVFPKSLPAKTTKYRLPVAVKTSAEKTGHVQLREWIIRFDEMGAIAKIKATNAKDINGLQIRARKDGDRLWKSETKFNEIFTKAGIPLFYRDYVPVLSFKNKIISCPILLRNRRTDIEINWKMDEKSPVWDLEI